MNIKNYDVKRGSSLIIILTLTVNNELVDFTDWTVTWAGMTEKGSRLWWAEGEKIDSNSKIKLAQVIDTTASKIIYDVLFSDPDGNNHHYLQGNINVLDAVTPIGTPP